MRRVGFRILNGLSVWIQVRFELGIGVGLGLGVLAFLVVQKVAKAIPGMLIATSPGPPQWWSI